MLTFLHIVSDLDLHYYSKVTHTCIFDSILDASDKLVGEELCLETDVN